MVFTFIAVSHIPMGDALTVVYASPLFTMILSFIFLGHRLRLYKLSFALVLIVGIILVVRPPFLFPNKDQKTNHKSHDFHYFWGIASAFGGAIISKYTIYKIRCFMNISLQTPRSRFLA